MTNKLYYELLEIIEGQNTVIESQNKIITRLVNNDLERENYIEELSKEVLD